MLNSEQMDFYCHCYDGRKANFNEKTWKLIDELFELINKIEPCGKDNLPDQEPLGFEEDISDLISCLIEEVSKIIVMMEKDEYNEYICKNLSYLKRYGTITRKDYYKIYENERNEYLKNISKSEIEEFETLISEQQDKEEIDNKLDTFTARDFYNACYLGYTENKYENVENYSPKEAYYRYADGRDEGLKDIDINSEEEFAKWYFDENKDKMIKYATWQPTEKQYLK